jgi:hypothetical protein
MRSPVASLILTGFWSSDTRATGMDDADNGDGTRLLGLGRAGAGPDCAHARAVGILAKASAYVTDLSYVGRTGQSS